MLYRKDFHLKNLEKEKEILEKYNDIVDRDPVKWHQKEIDRILELAQLYSTRPLTKVDEDEIIKFLADKFLAFEEIWGLVSGELTICSRNGEITFTLTNKGFDKSEERLEKIKAAIENSTQEDQEKVKEELNTIVDKFLADIKAEKAGVKPAPIDFGEEPKKYEN